MNFTTCPPPTLGANKTFSLVMIILYPILYIICFSVFLFNRKKSLYLRKRSFTLIFIGSIGTILMYIRVFVYDYIGPDKFPCAFQSILVYCSCSVLSTTILLKLGTYVNKVSEYRLSYVLALQKERNSVQEPGFNKIVDIDGEVSLTTFLAHIRYAFGQSRKKEDKYLSAKFNRTKMYYVFWGGLTTLPYTIGYLIRLGTDANWNSGCYGCDLEEPDFIFLLTVITFSLLIVLRTQNPVRISKFDALRIVRECMTEVLCFGVFEITGLALLLSDPGVVHKSGQFNWLFICFLGFAFNTYIETVHQVLIARRLRKKLLLSRNINLTDIFSDVMASKELKDQLRNHLNSELSPEILMFLDACEEYKRNFIGSNAENKAKFIIEMFVKKNARYEVNVSSTSRDLVLKSFQEKHVDINLFSHVYDEVKFELLKDGFARFLLRMKSTRNIETQVATLS